MKMSRPRYGVGAEGLLLRSFRDGQTDLCFEPLALAIEKSDETDRSATDDRGQVYRIIEGRLRLCI